MGWMLFLLLAAPTQQTGLFGVSLGARPAQVRAAFMPVGEPNGAVWTEQKGQLSYRCEAKARCFTVPSEADFFFVNGRLAAATLWASQQGTPPGERLTPLMLRIEAGAQLGTAVATTQAAGRRTRYFRRPKHTIAWVQDGIDVELKLYLDAAHPLGIAEAVAAGAEIDLKGFAGAADYAAAHEAIGKRWWPQASAALTRTIETKGLSPLLRREATLVLGMVLAARVQAEGATALASDPEWRAQALADLRRAKTLAPTLAPGVDEMVQTLGLKRPPTP